MATWEWMAGSAALITFLVVVVAPTVLVIRRFRRLSRANRVAPGHATAAPLWWMWTPGPAAVLHRRLRAAVAGARYSVAMTGVDPVDPLRDTLAELETVARSLDDGVVAASSLPRAARVGVMHEMAINVARVERTAEHLCATANRFVDLQATPAIRLRAVHERLAAVDDAMNEVRRIESDAGVNQSEPARPGSREGGRR